MKRKGMLKWFTLIEMIIVMVIIGILAVVLTESYLTVSKTALRVEQEKNISEESLILTQIFQAISDEATIDYDRYDDSKINLENSGWFIDVLYLTGGKWAWASITASGNCLELEWNFVPDDKWNINKNIQDYTGCSIILEQNGIQTQLTTPWKVVVSKVMFRVIPYNSDEYYFKNWKDGTVINNIHQPAFWMFIHLYAPLYQPTGTNKVDQPLQLFFNLNL